VSTATVVRGRKRYDTPSTIPSMKRTATRWPSEEQTAVKDEMIAQSMTAAGYM